MDKTCTIVLPSFAVGGAEVHTNHLAQLLIQQKYRLDILCAEGVVAEFLRSNGHNPMTVRGHSEQAILAKLTMRLAVKRPKNVVVIMPWPDRIWVTLLLPKSSNIVSVIHCLPVIMGKRWRRKWFPGLQRRLWQRFSRTVTVSERMSASIKDEVALPAGIIKTVPNPAWCPDDFVRSGSQEAPQLLYVGRLDRQKNLAVVLHALTQITDIPWHLSIAGEGGDRESLENIVTENSLSNRVTFFGQCDPWPLYATHDLLVFPSDKEAMPLVPQEALIAGLSVLAADCPALREVFSNAPLLWTPPHDESAWAKAIALAINDSTALTQRGGNSMEYAKKNFSATQWEAEILNAMGF